MGYFGYRDTGAGKTTDFGDFGSPSTANPSAVPTHVQDNSSLHDTADHIARDGDVLGSQVRVVQRRFGECWGI